MHPHTIDWLRNIEISVDKPLAEKRWNAASTYLENIDQSGVVRLLELFVSPKASASQVTAFTTEMLKIDPEFPVSGNLEKVRAMAGLVMAVSFSEQSHVGYAFALGLKVSQLPNAKFVPAIAGIAEEAEKFLFNESEAQRPEEFVTQQQSYVSRLTKRYQALQEAENEEDTEKQLKARQAYHQAVADHAVGRRIQQLAEESQLLWLVVGEYSPSLKKSTTSITAVEYCLVLAAEAAVRINLIPPPPSIDAILFRALSRCKEYEIPVGFAQLLDSTHSAWREKQLSKWKNDKSRALLPFLTAIEKMQELGDGSQALQALKTSCPLVRTDQTVTPIDAARYFFAELMFLTALKSV